MIVETSEMQPDRVAQFIDILFQYIDLVSAGEFYAQDIVERYSASDLIDSFDTL